MRKITLTTIAILGAIFVLTPHAAQAQVPNRTWVAKNGLDSNPCSRSQPCASFQHAHDVTNPGGEINCVDASEYLAVTINKSISIVCDNTEASILGASFAIVVSAGANDIITLKGLDLDGIGVGSAGIVFISGAALHVYKVQIRNFRASSGNSGGIYFQPNTYAEFYIADSTITDNGVTGQFDGGIVITPGGAGSANAFMTRVQVENNFTGISVDGTRSTGVAVNAIVRDSVVAGSGSNGIAAVASGGSASVSVLIDGSKIATNFGSGINANGAAASGAGSAIVRLGNSTVANNISGVSTTGAGVAQSFKNNHISGNLTDGTPIAAFPGPGGSALQ